MCRNLSTGSEKRSQFATFKKSIFISHYIVELNGFDKIFEYSIPSYYRRIRSVFIVETPGIRIHESIAPTFSAFETPPPPDISLFLARSRTLACHYSSSLVFIILLTQYTSVCIYDNRIS